MGKMSLEISAIRQGLKRELCGRIYRLPMGGHFDVTLNGPRNVADRPMEYHDPSPIGVSFKKGWLVMIHIKEDGTWKIFKIGHFSKPILKGDFMNPEAFKIITDTVEKTIKEEMMTEKETLWQQL